MKTFNAVVSILSKSIFSIKRTNAIPENPVRHKELINSNTVSYPRWSHFLSDYLYQMGHQEQDHEGYGYPYENIKQDMQNDAEHFYEKG